MESLFCPSKRSGRRLPAVFLGLLLLWPGRSALAVDGTFINTDGLVNYLPSIQATNFLNEAQFSFSNSVSSSWQASLYNNWQYVQNFTNTIDGEMDCNSGFYFNTWTPQNSSGVKAANFYNSGPINCGINNNFYVLYSPINAAYSYGGYGGIDVWATNIYNSGAINIGVDGLARFVGDNINFENGNVILENVSQVFGVSYYGQFAAPYINATGQADINTNNWNPGNLGSTYAYGNMNSSPFGLNLSNSVPYFYITGGGTNYTVRMIFLQDTSVGVTTNVYFNNFLGDGSAHVEWVGTYTDPVTGQPVTHYLYLDDDYVQGSSSNILNYGNPGVGVPNNYNIYPTTTQQFLGVPAVSGYTNGLLSRDTVSNNIYSYVNAQMVPADVPTNQMLHGLPSLLPGRVEITAAKSLNLTQAAVAGMNYLLLNSTNEFDSDGQSTFAAPYADIFLGHTNGNLTVSNVIASAIANWSGTVRAWNTRWFYTDTNNLINNPGVPNGNTNAINYDFRVLLVASQLVPNTAPQAGNFQAYSSNNVVISDVLNITSNLFLNCTNLLLTTNGIGVGATSPDGELNLSPTTFSWAAATARLRCLTNNGAIRTANPTVNVFGSASLSYLALVNTGVISNSAGATANTLDFENYGTILAGTGSFAVQSLTSTLSNGVVLAGGSFSDTASNLVISGTSIQAGKSLTLTATNLLTDNGVASSNYWSLGAGYAGSPNGTGLALPVLPATGDLLGTTITNIAVNGTKITDTWAGVNYGYSQYSTNSYSAAGFHNNAAIGQLVLDAQSSSSKFYFTGTGTNNAIYVDCLYLQDYAAYNPTNHPNNTIPQLFFNTNLVIYYAQAINPDGSSVAEKINGYNTNHLRWVSSYAGAFSSTNLVYPDGTTNTINAALAASPSLDSDRDGTVNSHDPTPVLVSSQVPFILTLITNHPPLARLQWRTIPLAGNYIFYKTNLTATNWLPFTNFNRYYWSSNNIIVTNPVSGGYFISPQPYIGYAQPVDNSEETNVWIFDTLTNGLHFYRVMVQPN